MLTLGTVKFLLEEVLPNLESQDSVVCLSRSNFVSKNFQAIVDYMHGRGLTLTEGAYTGRELLLDVGFKQYDDIDFVGNEGVSIVHDMNTPLPATVKDYDLVLECGTLEHIFDVAQVFRNIIQLCKVNGTVCHISPLNWINHGFYNFSLTLFYDVYRNNGFEDFKFWIFDWPFNYGQVGSSPAIPIGFTPTQITPARDTGFLMVGFTAKKKTNLAFKIPIQAAYDPELALNTNLRTHRI
jgi:SAM-dependent methyltransferase